MATTHKADELKAFLDHKVALYNQPNFIENDCDEQLQHELARKPKLDSHLEHR